MKNYSFPAQAASDECPKIPKAVTISASCLHEATMLLADTLKVDPALEKDHPEFMDEKLRTKSSVSKSEQRRLDIQKGK
jgi:hypothetical protein